MRLKLIPDKMSLVGTVGVGIALALNARPCFSAPHAPISSAAKSPAKVEAAKTDAVSAPAKQRPFNMTFLGGMSTSPKDSNVLIMRGLPGRPGIWKSEDTTATMMEFAWNTKTHVGVATGDPRLEDPHNTMTADKITIEDHGTPAQRRAILDGHVQVIHHPDSKTDPNDQAEFGEIFTHDITMTCDHAEYYYRLKTGSATGHLLMVGQDKQNSKTVRADLTANRLEFEEKNNLYRAVGNVLIHDGQTTATTPELDAVSVTKDGKRQVQSITMAGPFESTGLFDDSDTSDTSTSTGAAPTPAAAGSAKPGSPPTAPAKSGTKPAAPASTGGGATPAAPASAGGGATPAAPGAPAPAIPPTASAGSATKVAAKGTGGP
ncbi:MAG TPA: hypothetical protein VFJ58_19365 [Armatimonadota bacterium]|nr:hypothetical protein [Armatimonadota bacterium]